MIETSLTLHFCRHPPTITKMSVGCRLKYVANQRGALRLVARGLRRSYLRYLLWMVSVSAFASAEPTGGPRGSDLRPQTQPLATSQSLVSAMRSAAEDARAMWVAVLVLAGALLAGSQFAQRSATPVVYAEDKRPYDTDRDNVRHFFVIAIFLYLT